MASTRKTIRIIWMAIFLAVLTRAGSPAAEKSTFSIDDSFAVAALNVADATPDGRWLACTLSTGADRLPQDHFRSGDPTYVGPSQAGILVMDTETGKQTKVFPSKRQVRGLKWSPDGTRLAMFVFEKERFRLTVWTRATGKFEDILLPADRGPIASNSELEWSPDGLKLYFALRAPEWEKKSAAMFHSVLDDPIMAFDSEAPFLPWDSVTRRGRYRSFVSWDLKAKKLNEILPETALNSVRITKDGTQLVYETDITEKTSYEEIGGTTNKLEVIPLAGGKSRLLLDKYARRRFLWTKDGLTLAYADKGDIFVMALTDTEARCLTKDPAEEKEKKEAAKTAEKEKDPPAKKEKQTFDPLRFSPDGTKLFCSSTPPAPEGQKEDDKTPRPLQYWLIDVKSGARELVLEVKEEPEKRPTRSVVDWAPDGNRIYFTTSAQDRWDRGLIRLDLRERRFEDLVRGDRLYGRWALSEDGRQFLFTESDGDHPEDYCVADAEFKQVRRLTDLNPWIRDRALTRSELIAYRDADGKELKGVLYYPVPYEKGKKYPMIVEVYERFFDNGFSAPFNIYASAGYAVLRPSVNLNIGYPGEAWAKGALAAVNKVIDMGVADPEKLGIQGTSYGGYATVLLLTQTDRFKAAINNSGKVNMVSFYTQSPRLGVRNTHAPEKSQDRIGGTLWEYPERYLAHSAILQADRIKTPILCITGDQDPNVEALQSQEIFYALRRLGKKVVWLRYHGGPHGGPNSNEERRDMYTRMLDWYGTYLKGGKKSGI